MKDALRHKLCRALKKAGWQVSRQQGADVFTHGPDHHITMPNEPPSPTLYKRLIRLADVRRSL